jgi:EmrB/QacA subfamily drug resistance transporter
MFMASLDESILTIGLPTVLQDLNTTVVHGIWIITGYRLMITTLLVLLGRLGDMHGRVRLYNMGFAVFTAGSLLCGFSATGEQLVAFRFLQGVGGALLITNSAAIVTDSFPLNELGAGLGTNMVAYNTGAVFGYTLSGAMITLFGWRSIFFINVPIGVFGTFWAYKRLKELGKRNVGERFDYVGSTLYCVALSIILYGMTIGNPLSLNNLSIIAFGLMLFLVFIIVESRQKHPMLDLSLFKLRLFAAGNLSSFSNSLAYNCIPFIMGSLYLQLIKGYDPFTAGLMMIPMEAIVLVMSPISGRLSDKYGNRGFASLGLALNAAAQLWLSTLNEKSSYIVFLAGLSLFGFGRALFTSPNTSSIMGSVAAERRGLANGVRTTLNQTGMVLSVPLSLLLMTSVIPYDMLSRLVSSTQLTGSEYYTFLAALNRASLILGVITLVAIIPSLLRGPRAHTALNLRKDT